MKVILIRYSEIHLKGNNRGFFENALINNIRHSLADKKYKLVKQSGRYVISEFEESEADSIVETVRNVFGVYSVSLADEVKSDYEEIKKSALAIAPESGTFKVVCNRADKRFPLNSMQLASSIGGDLLENNGKLSVDLHKPQHLVNIDVRENGKTFVFTNSIKGVNGMPVGTGGKGVLLLSGGIDSPAACYMMAKRGMSIRAIHFHSYPFTSLQAKEKVLTLAKILKKYTLHMTVDVVSFTEIQTAIHEKCPEEFMITIMRRFMMRIAERLAKKYGCGAIITGESLGQVASQTLESITSTNAVATLPVLRPLIGFDKDEIIEIAKRIDTFETSILPYEDCCTIFLPKNPVTKPRLDVVKRVESVLDIDALVEQALENVETIAV